MKRQWIGYCLAITVCAFSSALAAPPKSPPPIAPPTEISAEDARWDGGNTIDVSWKLSADDVRVQDAKNGPPKKVLYYKILRAGQANGAYREVGGYEPDKWDYLKRRATFTVTKCENGEPYFFRVLAVGPKQGGKPTQSAFIQSNKSATAGSQWFDASRLGIGVITLIICGAVVYWISHARKGKPLKIRKIAGLDAVEEAVGRATEMGRSVLFIPGIQDMNDIQTIAGLTVLSSVAKTAAEYDAKVEVPTSRSLVMTTAREIVQAAFLEAGRPDAYNQDFIYYVTDEQFGYVAYLSGMMVREKPAACFYMGTFYAESLILAETGNAIGAIQIAGTAMPAQLPFFVAACDYTLIGEEFFAASAYLSGEPAQLGSLKGQDVGKIITGIFLVAGSVLATLVTVFKQGNTVDTLALERALHFIKETVLK